MLTRVRGILSMLRMDPTAFNSGILGSNIPVTMPNGDPVTEGNVDEFIRERTEIWRQTWVIKPLEEVRDELTGTLQHEFVMDPSYGRHERCRLCNHQRIHKIHW